MSVSMIVMVSGDCYLKLRSIAIAAQPLLVSICKYRAGGSRSEMQFVYA